MKYGILVFDKNFVNVGDTFQTLGIIGIYKKMRIEYEELVKISLDDLKSYDGEEIVLPISTYFNTLFWNFNVFEKEFYPFSDKIIPVFTSTYCTDEKILRYFLKYKNTVFGTRDLETKRCINNLFGEEKRAFMAGGVTLTFEKREQKSNPEKVYAIDVPEMAKAYIPDEFKDLLVYKTQDFDEADKDVDSTLNIASAVLKELSDNAKLVITSRLHVALPCIAMNIPVVVMREVKDDRFSGYDELVHVYTPNEWESIDFNCGTKDVEWLKEEIIRNVITQLENAFNGNYKTAEYKQMFKKKVEKVDSFFENNQTVPYYAGEFVSYLSYQQKQKYLQEKYEWDNFLHYVTGKKPRDTTLVIYGAGGQGYQMLIRYRQIIKSYKNCFFVNNGIGKKEKVIRYNGFEIHPVSKIQQLDKDKCVVIVAINKYYSDVSKQIEADLVKLGFREGKEFYHLQKLDNSALLPIDDIALNTSIM